MTKKKILSSMIFIFVGFMICIGLVFAYRTFVSWQKWLWIEPITVMKPRAPSGFRNQFSSLESSHIRYIKEFSVLTLPEKNGPVFSISESPNEEQLLVVYANGTLIQWDIEEQLALRQFTVSGSSSRAVFSADGSRLLVPDGDFLGYTVWDVINGTVIYCDMVDDCPYEHEKDMATMSDYYLLANGKAVLSVGSANRFDVDTFGYPTEHDSSGVLFRCDPNNALFETLSSAFPQKIILSPSQQYVAYTMGNGDICIYEFANLAGWDPQAGQEIYRRPFRNQYYDLNGTNGGTRDLDIDPHNRWLAVLTDQNLAVWNMNQFFFPEKFQISLSGQNTMSFSRSGSYLAVGGDDGLKFYEPEKGSTPSLFIKGVQVTAIYFSRDNGLLIWGDKEGKIHIWGQW